MMIRGIRPGGTTLSRPADNGIARPGPRLALLLAALVACASTLWAGWVVERLDEPGDLGRGAALAAGASGNLQVAYLDATNSRLKVATRGADWAWSRAVVDTDVAAGPAWRPAVAEAAGGSVHAVYRQASTGYLRHAVRTGGAWSANTVFAYPSGGFSLALDAGGNALVAFRRSPAEDLYLLREAGGSWTAELASSSGNAGGQPSMVLAAGGDILVSHHDDLGTNLDLEFSAWDGSAWGDEALDTTGEAGRGSSMAVDAGGNVLVAYLRADAGQERLRLATRVAGAWTLRDIAASTSAGGAGCSLALDAAGEPWIAFASPSGNLAVAWRSGGAWNSGNVDGMVSLAAYPSLAFTPDGHTHIAYQDAGRADLRHAWDSVATTAGRVAHIRHPCGFDVETGAGNVMWTTSGPWATTDRVHIEYSTDAWTSFGTLAANVLASDLTIPYDSRLLGDAANYELRLSTGTAIYTTSAGWFSVSNNAISAPHPVLDWAFRAGSPVNDYLHAAAARGSGNLLLAGSFGGTSVDFDPTSLGVDTEVNRGGQDFFLAGYAAAGNIAWARSGGGTGHDFAYATALDAAGNVAVAGSFYSTADFDPGAATENRSSNGGTDAFICLLDPCGNLLWARAVGGAGDDAVRALAMDAAGNVYAGGTFNDTVDFDTGSSLDSHASAGGADAFLTCYLPSGNVSWTRTIGGSGADAGLAVAVDLGGNVYLAGSFSGNVDFDPGAGVASRVSNGGTDAFLAAFGPDGTYRWAGTLGGGSDDAANAVGVDRQDFVYVAGGFQGSGVDVDPGAGTDARSSAGGRDAFLCQYGTNGIVQWTRTFGGTSEDEVLSLAVDEAAHVCVGGSFLGSVDFDTGSGNDQRTSAGNTDLFVSRFDSFGERVWSFTAGGTSADRAAALAVDGAFNVYPAGTFQGTADLNPTASESKITAAAGLDAFAARFRQEALVVQRPRNGDRYSDLCGIRWSTAGGWKDDATIDILYTTDAWLTATTVVSGANVHDLYHPWSLSGLYDGDTYAVRFTTDGIGFSTMSGTFIVDRTPPSTTLSYSRTSPMPAGNVLVTARYSEVLAAAPAISIDQPGTEDVSGATMTMLGNMSVFTYDYTITAQAAPAHRDGEVEVLLSATTDLAGNLSASPNNITFDIDTVAPTVAITCSEDPADRGTVTITATYSEPPTAAPALTARPPLGSANVMSPAGSGNTYTYTYTVTAADGDGTVGLTLAATADATGNAAWPPSGNSFRIDTTYPSVTLSYSPSSTMDAGNVLITATYSENVTTIPPAISIAMPGSLDITSAAMTDTGDHLRFTYDCNIGQEDGGRYLDGTATVSLSATQDAMGYATPAPGSTSIIIDTTGAAATLDFSRASPMSNVTLRITSNFSKMVAASPTITVRRPGASGTLSAAMTNSGNNLQWYYDYTVQSANAWLDDGPAGVSISSNSFYKLHGGPQPGGNTFTIDTTAPVVTLGFASAALVAATNTMRAGTLEITASCSEVVTSAPNISIAQPGNTDVSGAAMTAAANMRLFTYSYVVHPDNGVSYRDGAASVSLDTVQDAAGNASAALSAGNTFTIDTAGPAATLGFAPTVAEAGNLLITASYSDAVTGAPTLAIVQPGTADLAATAMTAAANMRLFTYAWPVQKHDGTAWVDGTAYATLSTVYDASGNPSLAPSNNSFPIASRFLAGHWPLENDANDASGRGHHAATAGGPGWTTGIVDTAALSLDGVNDHLDLPDSTDFGDFSSLTVSAWARFDTLGGNAMEIVGDSTDGGQGWRLVMSAGNTLAFHPDLGSSTVIRIPDTLAGQSNLLVEDFEDGDAAGWTCWFTANVRADAAGARSGAFGGKVSGNADLATGFPGGLVAWWSFDEGAGSLAADLGGNAIGAALANGVGWTSGNLRTAGAFDGVDDVADGGNTALLDLTGGFTLSLWLAAPQPFAAGGNSILSRMDAAGNGYALGIDGNDLVVCLGDTGGNAVIPFVNAGNWQDGRWYHLAVVHDPASAANVICYVDGVEKNRAAVLNAVGPAPAANLLMGRGVDAACFSGNLDEVRIYGAPLSAAQVGRLFHHWDGPGQLAPVTRAFTAQTGRFLVDFDARAPTDGGNALWRYVGFSDRDPAADATDPYARLDSTTLAVGGVTWLSGRLGASAAGKRRWMGLDAHATPTGASFTPGQWQHVQFIVNVPSQGYELYVDGVYVGTYAFSRAAASISSIAVGTWYQDLSIDNLQVCTRWQTDTWYHLALTHDAAADRLEFFVDGVSDGGNSWAGGLLPCGNLTAGRLLDGRLDDLRIYNHVLDTQDLSALQLVADITAPAGGESWSGTQSVTWSRSGAWATPTYMVDIRLSTDAWGTYRTIGSANIHDRTLSWDTTQGGDSDACRLRLSSNADGTVFCSSNAFSVRNRSVTFAAPLAGQTLAGNTAVTWTTTGDWTGRVADLEYSTDDWRSRETLAAGVPVAAGSRSWFTYTYADAASAQVRLVSGGVAYSTSASFALVNTNAPVVTITTPASGAAWYGTRTITWTRSGAWSPGDLVQIEASDDGWATRSTVATGVDIDSLSRVWATTGVGDGSAWALRVTKDGIAYGTSAGSFTVDNLPLTLDLTTPAGGESWRQSQVIAWTTAGGWGYYDTVAIEASDDNWASQTPVATVPVHDLSYTWNTALAADGNTWNLRLRSGGTTYDQTAAAFTVDNTSPTGQVSYSADPAGSGNVIIYAAYDEPVSIPSVSIDRPGPEYIGAAPMTDSGNQQVYAYTYQVRTADGRTYTDGNTSVSLSTVTDRAGNTAAAVTTDLALRTYTLGPQPVLTYSADPAKAGTVTVTASYNARYSALYASLAAAPTISIDQPGASDVTLAAMTNVVSGNGLVWSYDYTVSASDGLNYRDGTAVVTLSTVYDPVGNAAYSPAANTFTIDTTPPVVTVAASADPVPAGSPVVLTATCSEPVSPALRISLDQPGTADVSQEPMFDASGNGTVFTYTWFSRRAEGTAYMDGTAGVTLSASQDAAGNASQAPSGNSFTVQTLGLALHWGLDEGGGATAYDASGRGHDGTLAGVSWSDGEVGAAAAVFDGTGGGNATRAAEISGAGLVSVAAWVRFDGVLGDEALVGTAGPGGTTGFLLALEGGTTMRFRFGDGAARSYAFAATGWTAGRWYHVAACLDHAADTLDLFVDGRLDTSYAAAVSPIVDSGNGLFLGARPDGSWRLSGAVDDLRLYNYSLSAAEVLEVYRRRPAVRLGFDGDGLDLTGNGHDATLAGGATYGANLFGASALSLDGTDDTASLAHDANVCGGGNVTVAGWFNFAGLSRAAVLAGSMSSGNGLSLEMDAGDTLAFLLGAGASNTHDFAGDQWLTGRWYHLAATYDAAASGNNVRLYVDGSLDSVHTRTGAAAGSGTDFWIGSRGGTSDFLRGRVDDLRLYARALSQEEVRGLSDMRYLALWHLDEGGGARAADSAGRGHHGTVLNASWKDMSAGGHALSFSGNGYVTVGNADDIAAPSVFTVAGRFRFGSLGAGMPLLGTYAASSDRGWLLESAGSGNLRFLAGSGSGNTQRLFSKTDWETDRWYHLAVACDLSAADKQLGLYVDGALDSEHALSALAPSGEDLFLGSRPGLGAYFTGWMDEVSISRQADTKSEVAAQAAANQAPVADPGGPYATTRNTPLILSGNGRDADGFIQAWEWDENGDGTADGAAAAYTFGANIGGYARLSLRVRDDDGAWSSWAGVDVLVEDAANLPPVANAGGPYTGASGSNILLAGSGNDLDGTVQNYAWDVDGDGEAEGAASTYDLTLAGVGTTEVRFRVRDDDGAWSAWAAAEVVSTGAASPPVAEAGASYTATAGQALTLSGAGFGDSAIDQYAWDLNGDGQADLYDQAPSFTWDREGVYTVGLRVQDASGVWSAWDRTEVEVSSTANEIPVAGPGGPYSGNVLAAVTLYGNLFGLSSYDTDGSVVAYRWTFEDGTTADSANVQKRWFQAGTYAPTLAVQDDDGAWSRATACTVEITDPANSRPAAAPNGSYAGNVDQSLALSSAGSTDPDGVVAAYAWDFGDNGISAQPNPSHAWRQAGTFVVSLKVQDDDGAWSVPAQTSCAVTDPSWLPPTVSVTASTTSGAAPLRVLFTASAADPDGSVASVRWDFDGDGVFTAQGASALCEYATPGTYDANVLVTDNDGLTAAANLRITATTVTASGNLVASTASGNAPLTVELTAGPPAGSSNITYTFTAGDGRADISSASANVILSYGLQGVYRPSVSMYDTVSGNTYTAETALTVRAAQYPLTVSASASPSSTYTYLRVNCTGTATTTSPTATVTSYEWDFEGDGTYDIELTTSASTSHAYTESGVYTPRLKVTDSANVEGTASGVVVVKTNPTLVLISPEDGATVSGGVFFQVQTLPSHGFAEYIRVAWSTGGGVWNDVGAAARTQVKLRRWKLLWDLSRVSAGDYWLRASGNSTISGNAVYSDPVRVTVASSGAQKARLAPADWRVGATLVERSDVDADTSFQRRQLLAGRRAAVVALDDETAVSVPLGALPPAGGRVTLSVRPAAPAAAGSGLEALGGRRGLLVETDGALRSPLRIAVPCRDDDGDGLLDGTKARMSEVQLRRLDPASGRWVRMPRTAFDLQNGTVSAMVTDLSGEYGLFREKDAGEPVAPPAVVGAAPVAATAIVPAATPGAAPSAPAAVPGAKAPAGGPGGGGCLLRAR